MWAYSLKYPSRHESAYQRERSKLHAYLHTYLQLKYVCINRECVKVCESPSIYLYCSELRILLPLSTVLIHSALSDFPLKVLLTKYQVWTRARWCWRRHWRRRCVSEYLTEALQKDDRDDALDIFSFSRRYGSVLRNDDDPMSRSRPGKDNVKRSPS